MEVGQGGTSPGSVTLRGRPSGPASRSSNLT